MRKVIAGLSLTVAFLLGALIHQGIAHAQSATNFTIIPIGPVSNCPAISTLPTGSANAACFTTSGIVMQAGSVWGANALGSGTTQLTINGVTKTCAPSCTFTLTAASPAPVITVTPTITAVSTAPTTTVAAQ